MHPQLPMSERVAENDSVLPLGQPIVNTAGETITEIPVTKGTHITVCTASLNRSAIHKLPDVSFDSNKLLRLESVWGPDANVFRPERWLEEGNNNNVKGYGPFPGL